MIRRLDPWRNLYRNNLNPKHRGILSRQERDGLELAPICQERPMASRDVWGSSGSGFPKPRIEHVKIMVFRYSGWCSGIEVSSLHDL